jgi:hypothetical protein
MGVDDLASFFVGSWRLTRRISDRGRGRSGRLIGCASFVPTFGRLRYYEEGILTFGDFRGQASRSLWFIPHGSGAEVRFEDGRSFHHIDLSSGRAAAFHQCGSDTYIGRYRVSGPNHWTLVWQILGPDKRALIGASYCKATLSGEFRIPRSRPGLKISALAPNGDTMRAACARDVDRAPCYWLRVFGQVAFGRKALESLTLRRIA